MSTIVSGNQGMIRLRPYLNHGSMKLDNNAAESGMRAITLGRKNYLFLDSEAGVKAASIAYTLIETPKLNTIDPYAWLPTPLPASRTTRLPRSMTFSHATGTHHGQAGRFHDNWRIVTNDASGAPTLTDTGASFRIATGGALTLFIAAPPNGSSVGVRVVDEVSGAVFEQEITADLPAVTQFLSPPLYINTGATAAAVAYDCAGVHLETDY